MKTMKEEKLTHPMLGKSKLTEDGSEDHSNSGGPMIAALRIEQRDNLGQRVRELILSEKLAMEAASAGYETFEDADDFDVPEDDTFDPQTPYEEVFTGSIQEDVEERTKHQRDQLRGIKSPKIKEFLEAMDPAEARAAILELGLIDPADDVKPTT